MEKDYKQDNAKLSQITSLILQFDPQIHPPTVLTKSLHIFRSFAHDAHPQHFMDQLDSILDFLYKLLKPTVLPYSSFSNVQENDQTIAVNTIFKFFIFITYSFNALRLKVAKRINFQAHFDKFVNLFISVKVEDNTMKGITTRGNVLIFGGENFNFTPSPSYFLQISATVKFLIEFHTQNFDKLATVLHQLLLIADSNAMQFQQNSKFPPSVIFSGNTNIAFSVLQNLSFLDEINVVQNKENELVFKSIPIAQMLQRQIFVQNYISDSKSAIRRIGNFSGQIKNNNAIESLCLIQFNNEIDMFVDRSRIFINSYVEKCSLKDAFQVEFLNFFKFQKSDEIRLFLMNQKRKNINLELNIQQLVQISNNEPKLSVLICKALAECRFISSEIIEQFKYLASKIAFQMVRKLNIIDIFKAHFSGDFTSLDLGILIQKSSDMNIRDYCMMINSEIRYLMEQTQQNYNDMLGQKQSQFSKIYGALADRKLFLQQFVLSPDTNFLKVIGENIDITDKLNIEAYCLYQVFTQTKNIEFVQMIIIQNPAILQQFDIVNLLSPEQVYSSLLKADELNKIQVELFSKQQAALEQQKEAGFVMDGKIDLSTVKDEVNSQITVLNKRLVQLRKGYCWYQLKDQQFYWGKVEFFSQIQCKNFKPIIIFLKDKGYLTSMDAESLLALQ
ncbi:hypothetical protein SS50377_22041 [Spironucleus salmonicida]|uniref:Uncharacterized protein n=1 Tax=Spironucleus salmonicida TaxID=348837 RepID=V6LYB5_9EUKA|nr:hypothetical protein SS50377_22041 [Spironucleus salmonicida]|eukprot:EST45794.1 Hypothetical protein SS50377_14368 [Spironucleus salmonicida]